MALHDVHGTAGAVGYWTHPEARGRGVMSAAVRHAFTPPRGRRPWPAGRRVGAVALAGGDPKAQLVVAGVVNLSEHRAPGKRTRTNGQLFWPFVGCGQAERFGTLKNAMS